MLVTVTAPCESSEPSRQLPHTPLEKRFIVFAALFLLLCAVNALYPPPHVPQVGLLLRLFRKGHFRTSWFLCLLTEELAEDKHLAGPRAQPTLLGGDCSRAGPVLQYPFKTLFSQLFLCEKGHVRVQSMGVVRITCGILPSLSCLTYR